jgi:hypothetical protein
VSRACLERFDIYDGEADGMPYDAKNVERLLKKLELLRNDRSNRTWSAYDKAVVYLSTDDKYEVGASIIMEIGGHIEKLQPYVAYIDERKVNRSDLSSERTDTNLTRGCSQYLDILGFNFVNGKMEGEIGYYVRTKTTGTKQLCELFIGKLEDSNRKLISKWTNALKGGITAVPVNGVFLPVNKVSMSMSQMTEMKEINQIMKTTAEGIDNCVTEFMHLEIDIDD